MSTMACNLKKIRVGLHTRMMTNMTRMRVRLLRTGTWEAAKCSLNFGSWGTVKSSVNEGPHEIVEWITR